MSADKRQPESPALSALEDYLREIAREEARAAVLENLQRPAPEVADEETRETVNQYLLISHKPYLTKKEVALYLDVSERSVGEWAARPADQNPFPESRAGADPRYRRAAVDEWAEREGVRRRLRAVG